MSGPLAASARLNRSKDSHILVVEDDKLELAMLAAMLDLAGYKVTPCVTADQALALLYASETTFDVVVSDVVLRLASGLEVLRAARAREFPPEVILISGFATLDSAIEALRAGSFDYLLKPFLIDDLCVRINAATQLRHKRLSAATVAAVGRLQFDARHRHATYAERDLGLSAVEYALLYALAASAGGVVSYQELLHAAQLPPEESTAIRMLHRHLGRLRRKIAPLMIDNVRRTGYALRDYRV